MTHRSHLALALVAVALLAQPSLAQEPGPSPAPAAAPAVSTPMPAPVEAVPQTCIDGKLASDKQGKVYTCDEALWHPVTSNSAGYHIVPPSGPGWARFLAILGIVHSIILVLMKVPQLNGKGTYTAIILLSAGAIVTAIMQFAAGVPIVDIVQQLFTLFSSGVLPIGFGIRRAIGTTRSLPAAA